MRRKLLAGVLALSMIMEGSGVLSTVSAYGAETVTEKVLQKSSGGNPVLGFDESGDLLYGGDPAVLVDGNTAYFYIGHDASSGDGYVMPDWRCYSTTDMKNFKYEGVTMKCSDIPWADSTSSWASQVVKYNGKYYLYYCAEYDGNAYGKCVGVAVSDSPTGPFVDKGEPLIYDSMTPFLNPGRGGAGWEDIDPTAWVETDEDGVEHRYLVWGNTNAYVAELNEDMISIKDRDGDSKITFDESASGKGDIQRITIDGMPNNWYYAEAPWVYRRQDSNGNYYGKYYLFYAMYWREQMAYATCDSLWDATYDYGGLVMEPGATSNTNHMAVVDFKGKTYFIYHSGALPWGSGFRRSVCVQELQFNDDGSIKYLQENAIGLTGTASKITDSEGAPIAHEAYNNSTSDSMYPYTDVKVGTDSSAKTDDSLWVLHEGKADDAEEAYVSIESYNKPGLYLQVESDKTVTMGQDYQKASSDGYTVDSKRMTFRTLEGFDGDSDTVTFESVQYPGYYLTSKDGELTVEKDPDKDACSFTVSTEIKGDASSMTVRKSDRTYEVGDTLKTDDIRITAVDEDGVTNLVYGDYDGVKIDASDVDTKKAGTYTLKVTYGKETGTVEIRVLSKK